MEALKWIHIATGFIALVAGTIALSTKKGRKAHRFSGKLFGYTMAVSGFSGIVLSLYIKSVFLLGIGLFSTWNVIMGILVFRLKRFGWNGVVIPITVITLAGTLAIASLSVISAVNQNFGTLFWLSLIFGVSGTLFLIHRIIQIKSFKIKGLDRVEEHINFMMGAYIASMSAFSATQLHFIPGILRWIWPTLLFSPIIAYQIRQWKKRIAKSSK